MHVPSVQPGRSAAIRAVAIALVLTGAGLVSGVPACLVHSACFDDADCPSPQICSIPAGQDRGRCRTPCRADADCAEGQLCDTARGRCEPGDCLASSDCLPGFECQSWRCVATVPLQCPDGMEAVGNRFCMDRHEASRPDATASSAGELEGPAGAVAGVLPWLIASNADAQTACLAAGKSLCTPLEWLEACQGPLQMTYAYGNRYQPSTCNGIDTYCHCDGECADQTPCPYAGCWRDCGAGFRLEPTGAFAGCQSADGVFDLNGNAWEHVLGGDVTTVRGGAYNCSDSQRYQRCDYIPISWTPTALGFRCCSPGWVEMDGGVRDGPGDDAAGVDGAGGDGAGG